MFAGGSFAVFAKRLPPTDNSHATFFLEGAEWLSVNKHKVSFSKSLGNYFKSQFCMNCHVANF